MLCSLISITVRCFLPDNETVRLLNEVEDEYQASIDFVRFIDDIDSGDPMRIHMGATCNFEAYCWKTRTCNSISFVWNTAKQWNGKCCNTVAQSSGSLTAEFDF